MFHTDMQPSRVNNQTQVNQPDILACITLPQDVASFANSLLPGEGYLTALCSMTLNSTDNTKSPSAQDEDTHL